jgi:ribosomal protein L7/L12
MNESFLLGLVAASVTAVILQQEDRRIKEYRAATGAGLQDAKEYVEELQRRASLR